MRLQLPSTIQFLPQQHLRHEPALELVSNDIHCIILYFGYTNLQCVQSVLLLQVEIHSQAAQLLVLSLRRLSIHYMQKLLLLVEQSVPQWHS